MLHSRSSRRTKQRSHIWNCWLASKPDASWQTGRLNGLQWVIWRSRATQGREVGLASSSIIASEGRQTARRSTGALLTPETMNRPPSSLATSTKRPTITHNGDGGQLAAKPTTRPAWQDGHQHCNSSVSKSLAALKWSSVAD